MKSWMEYGCTCPSCFKKAEDDYQRGVTLWNDGVRKIQFENWDTTCADECCYEYGTRMIINGVNVGEVSSNPIAMAERLCEFLGIENVKVDYIENNIDYTSLQDV